MRNDIKSNKYIKKLKQKIKSKISYKSLPRNNCYMKILLTKYWEI